MVLLCDFRSFGIESIINGSLFASGSAQGIFGGWSIAVLISAVNVIFGFMVGAFGANKHGLYIFNEIYRINWLVGLGLFHCCI